MGLSYTKTLVTDAVERKKGATFGSECIAT